MPTMSKRERVEAAIHGARADRPPVALWRHWPGDDQRADDLARAHLTFLRDYDMDLIKVTPNSGYSVEDWGVPARYLGNVEGTFEYLGRRVHCPDDWLQLPLLEPTRGALGRQLEALRLIRREVGEAVPILMTVFNPLSVAKYLAGEEQLLVDLRRSPEALREGLERISDSTVRFVEAAMATGISGIFLAVQHAQYGLLSPDEYAAFGQPYDLRVLEAASGAWLNLLHLHGEEVMFEQLADYPVQVINWHDRETPPNLEAALERFGGAVCGGLRQWETIVRGAPEDVQREAADALQHTGSRRFILGTGCVVPIVAPTANLRAARQSVERPG